MLLTPAQNQNRLKRDGGRTLFLPEVVAPHVYVRAAAWALVASTLTSHISTQTFRRTLAASVNSCAEIKSAPLVA